MMSNRMKFATDLSKGILGSPDSEELWTDIIAHIPDEVLLKPDIRILNVACGHGTEARILARRMIDLGVPKDRINSSIFLLDKYMTFTGFVTKNLGFKNVITADFLQWETDMKFDVVIGNPPYSKGTKLLYRYFFEKSCELSNGQVLMIMPLNLKSNYDSLKKLNSLVKKHQTHISDNVSHYFSVGQDNIHYVVCDINVENEIECSSSNVFSDYVIKFPERARLTPIKGNTKVSNASSIATGIDIIDKVYRGDKIVYRKVEPELVASSPQRIQTKYAVVTNHTPSNGEFNVAIVEDFDSTWSMSVFAYEVDTYEEAEKLKNWLKSDFVRNEVIDLMSRKNTYSVTLEMMRKLPYYE